MSRTIRILDELTINKIAAGEVIENPASVVKELVENSLDAGSLDIHVEVIAGGRQLIRVTDNGCGMSKDNALLCLERHATSKMRHVEDLDTLTTMGFRGEAIPSIAAISKFHLLTCAEEKTSQATLLLVEGGSVQKCSDAVRARGTTVEVRSLFFNVPVRKKFQHSPAQDLAAIRKTLFQLAMAHPEVRFELVSDQKSQLVAPALTGPSFLENLRLRVAAVLGNELTSQTIDLSAKEETYQLTGLIGLPHETRNNRAGQYLFLNRRCVASPLISLAVREGYGTALAPQSYPIFILHLEFSGDLLDVNVHPQKREVRLRQEQLLRKCVCNAVQRAIQKTAAPAVTYPSLNFGPRPAWQAAEPLPWETPELPSLPQVKESLFTPFEAPIPKVLATLPGYLILDPTSCFLLNQEEKGLWVVDQQAAHHRILHDRLSEEKTGPVETELLLIPLLLKLSALEIANLHSIMPLLKQLGFEIEPFGPHTLSVRAIPSDFRGSDIGQLLMALTQDGEVPENRRRREMSQTMSRLRMSRNKQLNLEEAANLMKALYRCSEPKICPIGRPIFACLESKVLSQCFQPKGAP